MTKPHRAAFEGAAARRRAKQLVDGERRQASEAQADLAVLVEMILKGDPQAIINCAYALRAKYQGA